MRGKINAMKMKATDGGRGRGAGNIRKHHLGPQVHYLKGFVGFG